MAGLKDVCRAFQGILPTIRCLNCQTLEFSVTFPDRESLSQSWQSLRELDITPSSRGNQLTVIVGSTINEIREARSEFPWLQSAN